MTKIAAPYAVDKGHNEGNLDDDLYCHEAYSSGFHSLLQKLRLITVSGTCDRLRDKFSIH